MLVNISPNSRAFHYDLAKNYSEHSTEINMRKMGGNKQSLEFATVRSNFNRILSRSRELLLPSSDDLFAKTGVDIA